MVKYPSIEFNAFICRLIDSQREILPDVPAIYFISPTDKNIRTISLDIQKGLYDQYYLNMIYPISRPHLEEIANAAVDGNAPHQVQKVVFYYFFPTLYAK